MSCDKLDQLLAEYVDGTLAAAEKATADAHLAVCESCRDAVADARFAMEFLAVADDVEAPAALVNRILHQTLEARVEDRKAKPGRPDHWWSRLVAPFLAPRFVMGMAMTILSFSMIGRFAGIETRQLTAADLHPAKVWSNIELKAHRGYDRAVKYYENLRLVYDIQSRLREWSQEEEDERKNSRRGEVITPANPPAGQERNEQ